MVRRPALRSLVPGIATLAGYERDWLRGDVLAGFTGRRVSGAAGAGIRHRSRAAAGRRAVGDPAGSRGVRDLRQLESPVDRAGVDDSPDDGGAHRAARSWHPGRYAGLAASLALVVGGLCLVAPLARLGFVADLLSRPILVGYLAGVALIMIVGHLGKLTGVPVSGESFAAQLSSFLTHLDDARVVTIAFAAAVLVLLFGAQRLIPLAPAPLLAILLATAAVAIFDLERHGIQVIGTIPQALPRPVLPDPGQLTDLLLPAASVLLVGYTDNILTARSFAGVSDQQ